MNVKTRVAASVLALAMPLTMAAKCKAPGSSSPNGNQGTVTGIEHHGNDTTVLYLKLNDGSNDTDTMVTSAHDWDYCNVGATWPKCLKSWK